MSAPVIRVEGIWKEYSVGSRPRHSTFYDLLADRLRAPFRDRQMDRPASDQQFYALREVSFEVERGAVLGVVGRNGAGKSTLLKILSRISAPSRGRVALRGRVASLLEVGTGFHPELTGRENIQLNATILGMRQNEIARKFEQIVAFSGVEKFLDTPVKRYSSGMYVRLAFAVAAHVEADILLIDEVLAVGDAEFQKRCLGMMGQVAHDGRTVLFVSHNITALRNLCTHGLLLNSGQVGALGSIDDVLKQYGFNAGAGSSAIVDIADPYSGKVAALRRVAVVAETMSNQELSVATPFGIQLRIEVRDSDVEIAAFVSCFDSSQNCVFTSGSFFTHRLNGTRLSAGLHEFSCRVPSNLLNAGDYALDIAIIRDRSEVILRESAVVALHVNDARTNIDGWHWPIQGVVRPKLEWSVTPIAEDAENVEARWPVCVETL